MLETHAGEKHMATDTCLGHMLFGETGYGHMAAKTQAPPFREASRPSRPERRIEPLRVVAGRIEPHNARPERSLRSRSSPRARIYSNSLK